MTHPGHRNSAGGIIRVEDVEPRRDLKGHPGCAAHQLIRPQTELSQWLHVTYNEIEFGGGIDPHHHTGLNADHAYFVLDGTVRARIGDNYFDVGPRSLMVFPCTAVHGFTVTSAGGARVLRLGASADGRTSGSSVFVEHLPTSEQPT